MKKVKLGDICEKGSSNIAQKDLEKLNGKYPIYGASGFIKNVDFYKQAKEYIAVVKDGAGVGRTMLLPAYSSIIGTMQYILPNNSIDIKYLYYVLTWMNLAKYCTGATIPHIYFKDYKDEEFYLPSLEEQKAIAERLDKVSGLIEKRKTQLEKLDLLIKSRFIEMFGEVGTNIKGWGFKRLGDCCTINPKKGEDKRLHQELIVSFVPMPAVSEKGEIDASEKKSYDEVKTGFTYFAEQDVLFAKITPCMENGKGAVAKGLCNGIGFGSTEFHVLRPIKGVSNPYWLYTVTAFKQFRMDAASNMTGSAGQRRVPASFLEAYKVSLPPIDLQNQFSAFVEQTDKSKSAIQQSLDKLETLKKALMQKYFG
jgi:type I restriction enzyme S subunit